MNRMKYLCLSSYGINIPLHYSKGERNFVFLKDSFLNFEELEKVLKKERTRYDKLSDMEVETEDVVVLLLKYKKNNALVEIHGCVQLWSRGRY